MYYTKEEFDILKKDYDHTINSIIMLLTKEKALSNMIIESPKIINGTIKIFSGAVGVLALGGVHLVTTTILPFNLDPLSGQTLSGMVYLTGPFELAITGAAISGTQKSIMNRLSFKNKMTNLKEKANIEEEKRDAIKEGINYFKSIHVSDEQQLITNISYLEQLYNYSRKDMLYSLIYNQEDCKNFSQEFYRKKLWYKINGILEKGVQKMIEDAIALQNARMSPRKI